MSDKNENQLIELTEVIKPTDLFHECGCKNCTKQSKIQSIILPKCNFESPCITTDICPYDVKKCQFKPKKCFRTVIDTKQMTIYDRPGKEHQLGKMNNCCPTWWLAYEHWDSGDDDVCKSTDKELRINWIPWIDIGTNRPCWEIKIRQGNRIKYKWDDASIRETCDIDMFCNNEKVYEFKCNDIGYGISKAQQLMIEMMEHPFNFMNPNEELNRRIWYMNQPAIINRIILDQGCIMVKYVGKGFGFDISQPWDKEEYDISEWQGEKSIKVDVFSKDIYWFRDEGDGEETDNDMVEITTERGNKITYPKALYEKIKYDVEWEFRNQFGIMRGGGDTIFFDRQKFGLSIEQPLTMPLKKYNEQIQIFHDSLVEKHKLKNE